MGQSKISLRCTDVPEDETTIRVCRRLERHIDEYRMDLVDRAHKEEKMILAITQTTENLDKLAKATAGPVKSWGFLMDFRKLVVWVSGFSGVAAVLYWAKDRFN